MTADLTQRSGRLVYSTRLLRTMRRLRRVAWTARVSIFASLLGAVGILVPGQSADAFRGLLSSSILQLVAFALSAFFAVGAVAVCGHRLTARFAPHIVQVPTLMGSVARHLPSALGLLLLAAIAIALVKAVHSELENSLYRETWDLAIVCFTLVIAAVVARCRRSATSNLSFTAVLAMFLLLVFSVLPVSVPSWLGAPTIFLLWIGSIASVGSILAFAFAPLRLPIFCILAAAAVLFAYLDLNDNHTIRHSYRTDFQRGAHLSQYEFQSWLDNRPDRSLYERRNYPVFIVSTEGGGIRAAYFAALVLASIQDRCPAFTNHVFAVSGVSGGSLGAAVFAATAKQLGSRGVNNSCGLEPKGAGEFQHVAEEVLKSDLLSPMLAAMLFPDLLQRFLPWSIEGFDRARAFEQALEDAWRVKTGGGEFSESFFDLSMGWRDRSVPSLVLNTTNVETGMRMAISHLDLYEASDSPIETVLDVNERLTMPLSTAVGLSARFPLIAPAGRIPASREQFAGETRRYVDGGYFENSGTATVRDILTAIRAISTGTAYNVDLYVLTIGSEVALPQYSNRGFGEILSPIRTSLNTREARGTVAVAQLLTTISEFRRVGRGAWKSAMIQFKLRQRKIPLPLGWALSESARNEIAAQLVDCEDVTTSADPDAVCNRDSLTSVLEILQQRKSLK